MITLTLLHPTQHSPIQSWTFEGKSAIQIGRAVDNQIVLYSAVVSRHHVEIRQLNGGWEVVNLGTNGTYVDDQSISQTPVVDGLVIRLARSGPQLQIRLGEVDLREGMNKSAPHTTYNPSTHSSTVSFAAIGSTIQYSGMCRAACSGRLYR